MNCMQKKSQPSSDLNPRQYMQSIYVDCILPGVQSLLAPIAYAYRHVPWEPHTQLGWNSHLHSALYACLNISDFLWLRDSEVYFHFSWLRKAYFYVLLWQIESKPSVKVVLLQRDYIILARYTLFQHYSWFFLYSHYFQNYSGISFGNGGYCDSLL